MRLESSGFRTALQPLANSLTPELTTQDPSQALSAMYFLALSWTRIGWATEQKGFGDRRAALMVNVIGSAAVPPNGDVFAAALREDVNPDEMLRKARKIADAI